MPADRKGTLHITSSVDDTQQYLAVSVKDNGVGIEESKLVQIFEPFFTTKSVSKGTGLGLSISYGIVQQHAGALTAHNLPHGGARFVLELPLALAA